MLEFFNELTFFEQKLVIAAFLVSIIALSAFIKKLID